MAAEEKGNTSETKKVDPDKEEEGELGAAVRRALGDGSKEEGSTIAAAVPLLLPGSALASQDSLTPSAGLLGLVVSSRSSITPSTGLPGLPAEDIERYREAFNDFDFNEDGHISTKELHQAFRRAGQNPDEDKVHGIINELDQDGSGKVEWPEFAACLAEMMKGEEEETAYRECFRVFSKDDEGCIPAEEMKFILSQVCSMEEAEEMLAVVDRNGDGVISYSEFRCMMGANPILL